MYKLREKKTEFSKKKCFSKIKHKKGNSKSSVKKCINTLSFN